MKRENLIDCFQDTLEKSKTGKLEKATAEAIKSNKVYKEGNISKAASRDINCFIEVYAGTTFEIAKKYCTQGKVAVLNFANPEIPGGGVCNGAIAQEECLCRSSNLYACISNENVFEEYYNYHRGLHHYFYTDRLIYTKDITVFKSDELVPQLIPEEEWFHVDVITCAAPYVAKRKYTNSTALLELFKSRIKNIFEAARDNNVDVIILGAFGCGAFKNPPLIVAEAFKQVICEQNYFTAFKEIVFAIKPTGNSCPNLNTFREHFENYSSAGPTCPSLLIDLAQLRFHKRPLFLREISREEGAQFDSWQEFNKYFGKQFSILGDSISTLAGYNPKGYKVFYSGENCIKSGVSQMEDTWWDQVISYFGGELLVNNSWSGSRVTKLPEYNQLFPSGCSDERTSSLHINDVKPDVIIVYLGTNDWAFGSKLRGQTFILDADIHEEFNYAYDAMLKKLKSNYPNSEIWCCTLSETYISSRPDFVFPYEYGGLHIEEYNKVIRDTVLKNHCQLIDLNSWKIPCDTMDGSHPTKEGMSTIAKKIIHRIVGDNADCFFDCKEEAYVDLQEEYVRIDPDITTFLYGDTLKLTNKNTGKTLKIQKKEVLVGRSPICDLVLESSVISRKHAIFYYENGMWFLKDNNSTSGTWLNGVKIQSGKKYQLIADDVIAFAQAERVIFYKSEEIKNSFEEEKTKDIIFLEAGMSGYKKSDYTDNEAFRIILSALCKAPLYVPIEVDVAAMFGNIDPLSLKKGEIIQPKQDVKMRILTLGVGDEMELIPLFTSKEEVNKGKNVSVIRFYPQDYLPFVAQMNKTVVINPFSENRFLLDETTIKELLLPLVTHQIQKDDTALLGDEKQEKSDDLIGRVIADKYEVLQMIGKGGFFKVYLVLDKSIINKPWAMKVCDKTNPRYSPAIYDMIMKEPYMMMKLDHPAIPRVVDIIEDEKYIFIVRDYVEGDTLKSIIENFGAQPVEKVVEWGKQLCDVLQYLHNLTPPHIYRDMKPGNAMLSQDGQLKLIDFGIMRTYDSKKNADTCMFGTRGYAAPEQFGGMGQTDARTDIFGLGMTLYHLVTGIDPNQPPYGTKSICEINPDLPRGLDYIISKCIELNPMDRYQSCEELRDALNNYIYLPPKKGIFTKLFKKK